MNDWAATANKLGGISRATVFRLWKNGHLGSVLIGTRRFSTDAQIHSYIAQLETVAV